MWIVAPDTTARCGDEPGHIRANERVARLLAKKAGEQPLTNFDAYFQRKEICQPKNGGPFSNKCGESDGPSVQRRRSDDEAEIRAMADTQARKKEGRVSDGAVTAVTSVLRAIREADAPEKQVVYVYDDPMEENKLHAVVRVAGYPTDFQDIRRQILAAFSAERLFS